MLSQEQVIDIIDKGESPYVEFKEENIKANDLAAEIVSFANMEGGTIIIGVSDSGIIKGVTIKDTEEKIMNICRNNCIPNIIPIYQEIFINKDKRIIMGLGVGIVGLPNVGKSTTFNALTKAQNAQAENYPFCTIEPNKAIVPVPDKRLDELAKIVNPDKIQHSTIDFVDIARNLFTFRY